MISLSEFSVKIRRRETPFYSTLYNIAKKIRSPLNRDWRTLF